MKTLFRHLKALNYCLLLSFLSCSEEFHQLTPLEGSVISCQTPPIERNIIGTWKFESNYTTDNRIAKGTVTFDRRGNITDPDSLFKNELYSETVTSKTYSPFVPISLPLFYQGEVFEVYLFTKQGKKQTTHFTVVTNECRKIKLSLLGSGGNAVGFTLTK